MNALLLLALCPAAPAPAGFRGAVCAAEVVACDRLEFLHGEWQVRFGPGGAWEARSGGTSYRGRWAVAGGGLHVEEWPTSCKAGARFTWTVRLRRTPGGLAGEGTVKVRLWRLR